MSENENPSPQTRLSRDEVARIIDPVNFKLDATSYGTDEEGFKKTTAYGHQLVALERADAILALLATPSQRRAG